MALGGSCAYVSFCGLITTQPLNFDFNLTDKSFEMMILNYFVSSVMV